jgi:hypothetical protein
MKKAMVCTLNLKGKNLVDEFQEFVDAIQNEGISNVLTVGLLGDKLVIEVK